MSDKKELAAKAWYDSGTMRFSIVAIVLGTILAGIQLTIDAQILDAKWTGILVAAMGIISAVLRSITDKPIVSSRAEAERLTREKGGL